MTSIERLYEIYNIISQSKEPTKHAAEYKEIIGGLKGGSGERRLMSQFLAKFFTHFPSLHEQALNAQFDLCEDEDSSIRKQAVKDLPTFCKEKKDLIPKVSDILAQLLQMEDQTELIIVQNSLTSLFKLDAKGTLTGIFYQIENGDEVVRERCMIFLQYKIMTLGSDVFTLDVENTILTEAKKILEQEVTEEEFLLMVKILKLLKVCKSIIGYKQIVDTAAHQIDLSKPLDTTDIDSVNRLASCLSVAVPYFSAQISSTKFIEYLCTHVIPVVNQLDVVLAVNGESAKPSVTLSLIKTFAEILPYAADLENLESKVSALYSQLLEVMPLPPAGEAAAKALDSGLSLEFSRVECLLYAFHKMAKNKEEFLSSNPDRLKDFRTRLQYFARASQAYQKRLREELAGKKGPELKTEENKIKLVALKTTANINTLIKDLFHQPPSYKSPITLSWKTAGPKRTKSVAVENGGVKRHAPITFDSSPNKSQKSDRKIYAPPRDKYSRGAGQFGGNRGRGRGRFRGRGGRN